MKLIGWQNILGQFNYAMVLPSSTDKMVLGLNKEDVLRIFGTPTKISPVQKYEWFYESSIIWFDKSFKVIGWNNLLHQLDFGLVQRGAGKISVGMSKDELLGILGSPTKIMWSRQDEWHYDSARITFDGDYISDIHDPLNTLVEYIEN